MTFRLPGTTYVVQRQQWVKIGATTSLTTRLGALKHPKPGVLHPAGMDWSAPLTLITTWPDRTRETELHRRFAEHRVVGEWFHATPVLDALWWDDLYGRIAS